MAYIKVRVEEGVCSGMKRKQTKAIFVTQNTMLWAMIYANRAHREMKTARELQTYVQWRKAQMDFIFDFSQKKLQVNREVFALESSYRNTLGFDVGMVMANIVCKSLLGLKHLYHLNAKKYAHNVGAHVDYLSQNQNGYYAIEAKGTLGDQWLYKAKALNQLANVSNVNGATPFKYAVLSRCKNLQLESRLIDPINESDENVEIPEGFWNYQQELYALMENEGRILCDMSMRYVQVEGAFFGLIAPYDRARLRNIREEKIVEEVLGQRRYRVEVFEDGTLIGIEQRG